MKDVKTKVQQRIKDLLAAALNEAIKENVINIEEIPDFYIEVPQDKEHGDFAANIAMLLARQAKMPPRKIAEAIAERIASDPLIEKVEVAGPGFINFYLAVTWANEVIFDVLKKVPGHGWLHGQKGKKFRWNL